MKLWSQIALSAYYHASRPLRAARAARDARAGRAPICVLFYHRVADRDPNPWTMPRAMFERQIDWLGRRLEIISLAEAQSRLRAGRCDRPAACLTFDDGYGENCEHALPLLVSRKIPFTYFVTAANVFEGRPFPHDAARGRPLRPNTLDELRALARAGVEIGAHTRTHCDLGALRDPARLEDEVLGAARDLEAALDRPIRYFAFPFGLPKNLNPAVFGLARAAGWSGVCSAYGGYNTPGQDAFHLLRVHADDDFARFRNWLTIDPRKRGVRQVEGEQPVESAP